jgi:hypothetical protein
MDSIALRIFKLSMCASTVSANRRRWQNNCIKLFKHNHMQPSNQTPRPNPKDEKNGPINEDQYAKDPKNVVKKPGKESPKPGDASYDALQEKIDPSRVGRHEGESQMNDENRTGGSSL